MNQHTLFQIATWIIPLIIAFLIWYDRDKLKVAPIGSSGWGWLFIGVGLFLFFVAARTVQARRAPSLWWTNWETRSARRKWAQQGRCRASVYLAMP